MAVTQTVAILGASPDPSKFAFRAMKKLQEHGHKVILVNPEHEEILGQPVLPSLSQIREPVETLTLYVGPQRLEALVHDILDLRPQRVLFNPGTESPALINALKGAHIHFARGCTLLLLDSGKF